jgi:hypothetical protein
VAGQEYWEEVVPIYFEKELDDYIYTRFVSHSKELASRFAKLVAGPDETNLIMKVSAADYNASDIL